MTTYEIREEDVYPKATSAEPRAFDLGEDEFIVDSEYRGANRIVVAIASPVEVEQCQWTLDSGEQCGRDATDGEYCWQHEP